MSQWDHLFTETLSCHASEYTESYPGQSRSFVPLRDAVRGVVPLCSRHASDLADGLIARLPKSRLTQKFEGSSIGDEFGI